MTRLLHYLTWTHDLGDGDVPLPSGGDTALSQTQLSAVITRHLEIIIMSSLSSPQHKDGSVNPWARD